MTEGFAGDGITMRDRLLARTELYRDVALKLADEAEAIADLAMRTLRRGGTLFFCGNGGSAADAQHLAAEYVVRLGKERQALAALALTVDSSVLTAGANDYGFERVFARQIEALGREGDLLFLHSTSGESENLLAAAEAARRRGVSTVALLAAGGGRLRGRVDRVLLIPTDDPQLAQEAHLALGHEICARVEVGLQSLVGSGPESKRPRTP